MNEDEQLRSLSADLRELRAEVGSAANKLDAHHAAYEADKEAQETRTKAAQRKAKRATLAAYVGIAVGVIGILGAWLSWSATQRINDERATRTRTSCEQTADKAVRDNEQDRVILDLFADLIAGASPESSTPSFLQPYVEAIEANLSRVRDCSDAGIALYFESNGTEGYLP